MPANNAGVQHRNYMILMRFSQLTNRTWVRLCPGLRHLPQMLGQYPQTVLDANDGRFCKSLISSEIINLRKLAWIEH
jgi:hypothetical protein